MHKALQRLEGLARNAMQTYHMIDPGDSVCVGVSGGKDSVALALVLARLSAYFEHPFTLHALTLDPQFGGRQADYAALSAFFAQQGIPHTIRRTNIAEVVFDIRKEPNPCALCANLRRGLLHTTAKELGCNKVALGHHLNDVVETFYMNLFIEGRIGCFAPRTYLSRKELVMIRPLVLAREEEIVRAVNALHLPVVKSACPADGVTQRQTAKQFVVARCALDPAFCQKTLGALQKADIDGWGKAPG